jgi:hypothetical protein
LDESEQLNSGCVSNETIALVFLIADRTRVAIATERVSTAQWLRGIQCEMARYVRTFMILMLAAFAAGTVVHAANATTMSAKMTLAAIDGADMSDCQDCTDGNGNMPSCDNVCVSPILAVVPSGQPSLPGAETTTENPVLENVTGRTGPPDPYPPRTTILS